MFSADEDFNTFNEYLIAFFNSSYRQILSLFAFVVLYCGMTIFGNLHVDVRHVCAFLAIFLADLSFWHGRSASTVEFIFVSGAYLVGSKLTFPVFQSLKMALSFVIFAFELREHARLAPTLRHLIGLKFPSCHSSAVAVGEDVHHYSRGDVAANSQDRSKQAMFAPCIGLSVLNRSKDYE
jgi:hypothetical protein